MTDPTTQSARDIPPAAPSILNSKSLEARGIDAVISEGFFVLAAIVAAAVFGVYAHAAGRIVLVGPIAGLLILGFVGPCIIGGVVRFRAEPLKSPSADEQPRRVGTCVLGLIAVVGIGFFLVQRAL